jgi:hypothetical protein
VAIAVLALWIATAVAGMTLLRAGGTARRRAVSAASAPAEPTVIRIGAVPLTADGKPPPGPHVRVATPAGEHPFLEFCHPALAVTGIACWLMFVLVHYRPFAWIALAILVVTTAVGLTWLAASRRAAWRFPPRLVVVHGLAVTLAIALTVLTAIVAST